MGRNSAFLKLHEVQSPTKTSHTEPLISNNEKHPSYYVPLVSG